MRTIVCTTRGWAWGLVVGIAVTASSMQTAASGAGCQTTPLQPWGSANRKLVRSFFDRSSARGLAYGLELVASEGLWITPDGVRHTRSEMASIIATLERGLSVPFQFSTPELTAEADRVWAEVRVHAVLRNERVYDNRYAFVFRVACGRILEVHEYSDTSRARTVFGG